MASCRSACWLSTRQLCTPNCERERDIADWMWMRITWRLLLPQVESHWTGAWSALHPQLPPHRVSLLFYIVSAVSCQIHSIRALSPHPMVAKLHRLLRQMWTSCVRFNFTNMFNAISTCVRHFNLFTFSPLFVKYIRGGGYTISQCTRGTVWPARGRKNRHGIEPTSSF